MAPDCEFLLATDADGTSTLTLSGVLTIASVGKIDHALRREKPEFSHLDISAVSELDTAGRGWFGALPVMPMPM
jgi:phospholipid/cholesterol/gamma-HCH transport system permease protein